MKTSPEGVAEIAGHEGIVLSPYRDSVGVWTVFVGHTAAAGAPDPAALPRAVAQPLAVALDVFRRDLAAVEARVRDAVTVPLAQHEFDALVSFDFNTGGIFRARLARLLNARDRAGAAAAFDGWRRPPEIAARREAEKRLFRDGSYGKGGRATIYPADAAGRVQWGKGQTVDALAALRTAAAPPLPTLPSEPPPIRQPDDPGTPPAVAPQRGSRLMPLALAAVAALVLAGRRVAGMARAVMGRIW